MIVKLVIQKKVARALAEAAGERACLNKADNEVAWDAFDVIFCWLLG